MTARVGAWKAVAWWPPGVRGGPHELRLIPDENADPADVARGISTNTLVTVPLAKMTTEHSDLAPQTDEALVTLRALDQGGRGRMRSPLWHALIAEEYTRLVASGERKPVQAIAVRTGRSSDAVREWVRKARQLGFLTAEPGKASGKLTDKARALLESARLQR